MNTPASLLVVDDIAANRETLRELLEPEHYRITEAPDGPEALYLAAANPPDLVLLDVMMPGMDGYEVCRRLRANPLLAEVPVIMVTALDDQRARLAGLEAGADDFITKPFNRAELRARVRTITRLSRYRRLHEAQAALRDSEKHFEALFELGPVAVYSVNAEGVIQDFNRHAVKLWGREPMPAEGGERYYGPFKICHPDGTFLPPAQSAVAGVCDGSVAGMSGEELLVERPDGTRLTILLSMVPLRDEQGAISCAISSFHDISERKRMEAARRESEERYRRLFNAIDEGFCVVEVLFAPDGAPADFRFIEVNPSFAKHTGLTDPVGRCGLELIPTLESTWAERFGLAALTGESVRFVSRVAGLGRWFDVHAFRFGDAESRHVALLLSDITERKTAELALVASEQWLRAVFEQAAVGVAHTDAVTGGFLRVNRRFCDIVGYTAEELSRLTFCDVTHAQDMPLNLENVARLRDGTHREFVQEKQYVRKDGSTVWANVAVAAIGPVEGAPASFIAFVQDTTERRRLDEHFLQAQKMEALGQFSGGVAHDFNNILAAIGGYTELSRLILKGNPEVAEHLDSVLRATGRAADLVKQILTFSRQQPQARRAYQLQPIIVESLKLMRAAIPATITFDPQIAADAPSVLANANQIHQILMNLGINASHAMKDRPGRLQVKLEKFEVDATFAATTPRLRPGSYVRISISDTGCGMDPVTLRRIFEPFFTTKPVGDGTGLGLSVVHGIMDSHDGAITVHSQPGEGTTFCLYFPVHGDEAAAVILETAPLPRGHGQRVLVVDDEEMIASLVQQTLNRLGYTAEFTVDPAAALARVQADPSRFSLVISDQTMPGMTGIDLAQRIHQVHPDLPFILMTGYSLSLTAGHLAEAGIAQLLLKPVTIHLLGTTIHAALTGAPPLILGSHAPYR